MKLTEALSWAAEFLPAQGPLTAFVHHNTLHAFQDLPFEEAVLEAARVYGCNAYMPSQWYRAALTRGRIRNEDIQWSLRRQSFPLLPLPPGVCAHELQMALLLNPVHRLAPERLVWHLNETGARWRFRSELSPELASRLRKDALSFVASKPADAVLDLLFREFPEEWQGGKPQQLQQANPDRLAAQVLWTVCREAVRGIRRPGKARKLSRHRDVLLARGGLDIDSLVHPQLSRWCAAFLDQGVADAHMPGRAEGLFRAVRGLYRSGILPIWMNGFVELCASHESALPCLESSLLRLGVEPGEQASFLRDTLLALKGWAGMIYQAQSRPDRMPFLEVPARLDDFCALRLLLEECALRHGLRELGAGNIPLAEMRASLTPAPVVAREGLTLAYHLFQVCQFLGLGPSVVQSWTHADLEHLFAALDSFSSAKRREILHQAYERRFEIKTLDALGGHNPHFLADPPEFQAIFCLDDREESTRRHLEEVHPQCQTFGTLGYFGIAMYFRAAHEPHPRPLCPVAIRPHHLVEELPLQQMEHRALQLASVRRSLGTLAVGVHTGSHTLTWGSLLSSSLGILTSIPSILQVLFPRRTGLWTRRIQDRLRPQQTRLALFREEGAAESDPAPGFREAEMADIVARLLSEIGLTDNFSALVLVLGHGSTSLNNPHEAAYDCGACGGGRGGPNARAFAQMANRPHVRELLAGRGISIPAGTVFVGAYHNTCDDEIEIFDQDALPKSHAALLQTAAEALQKARANDALERCRRFESAPKGITAETALAHVAGRAADLAQPRPELGHATNALAVVGRRARTRGLFLDRRAFLASYDPLRDTPEGEILERSLENVLPVGAGINLEYFFSRVDNPGYGCGTKLPHNVTSLIGVMEGYCSDLRTGLPWQMVEIHEPMRLLVIVEATRATLDAILRRRPDLERWVVNRWIKLAALDPDRQSLWMFDQGQWSEHSHRDLSIPHVEHSSDWFLDKRQDLDFAEIDADQEVCRGLLG